MPADFAGTWQKNIVKSAIAAAEGAAAKVEERRRTTPAVFCCAGWQVFLLFLCHFASMLLATGSSSSDGDVRT